MKFKAILHALFYVFVFFSCQYTVTAGYMMSLMAGALVGGTFDETAMLSVAEQVLSQTVMISLISGLLTILVVCLLQRIRGRSPAAQFGFRKINLPRIPTFLLFGFALNIFVSGTISFLPLPESVLEAFENQYAALHGDEIPLALEIFSIAVVTGITEEIVFRGLVHTRLSAAYPSGTVILISAVLFGAAHGTPLAVVYSALLGLLFGKLYEKFRSVLPSMLCHVAFNATSYLLAELGERWQMPLYLFSVAAVLFCAYRIFFRRPTFYDYAMDIAGEFPVRDNVQREILERIHRMQEDRDISPDELEELERAWEENDKKYDKKTAGTSGSDPKDTNNTKEI